MEQNEQNGMRGRVNEMDNMLSFESEVERVDRVERGATETSRWKLNRLVRQRLLIEHVDEPLPHFILRFAITRQRVAHHPSEFEACPFVTHLPWVEEARGRPMKKVVRFEHSEPVDVDSLTDGNVRNVALSQFGVLVTYSYGGNQLHFPNLVDGTCFVIEELKATTCVGWY